MRLPILQPSNHVNFTNDMSAPMLQGIGGIVEPPTNWLKGVADAVHAVGGLLIVDEVQSGIGRMGVPVASDLYGVRGDIMTVGKGLGGGFPVAACLVQEHVAQTVRPGEHGTTFGGAPLACCLLYTSPSPRDS